MRADKGRPPGDQDALGGPFHRRVPPLCISPLRPPEPALTLSPGAAMISPKISGTYDDPPTAGSLRPCVGHIAVARPARATAVSGHPSDTEVSGAAEPALRHRS